MESTEPGATFKARLELAAALRGLLAFYLVVGDGEHHMNLHRGAQTLFQVKDSDIDLAKSAKELHDQIWEASDEELEDSLVRLFSGITRSCCLMPVANELPI